MNEVDAPAIHRARRDLDALLARGSISLELAQWGHDTVGELFDAQTVYAHIAPIDDGDLSFYWVGGERSVSVILGADGDSWASVVDGARHRWTYETNAVRSELRLHLRQFSDFIQRVNPEWRLQKR